MEAQKTFNKNSFLVGKIVAGLTPAFLQTEGKFMLNEALRLIRVFHDMKSIELAKCLNISSSYLSEIEKGKKQPPFDLIKKYGTIFNIKPSAILSFSEKIEEHNLKNKVKKSLRFKMLSFLQAIENAST